MHQYSYDLAGNLSFVKNAGNTVTMASYAYTYDGLLATASFGASRTLANTWDADSNRVRLNVASGQYDFTYDPTAGIPAVIEEVNSGATSTTTAYYFREPSGSLIARQDDSGLHYYHFDALGSTRMLTSGGETGTVTVTDKYAYDAYGALLAHDRYTGSIDQPYQYVGQLGYYTHYQEPEFGLLQLGVRFYDPEVGRFTERDILATTHISPYQYSDCIPVAATDAWGLDATNPGTIGYGDGQNWGAVCDSLAEMWKCAHEMERAAWNEVLALGVPGMHNGPGDALHHCVGSCKMVAHCPEGTAELAGYGHEWTSGWGIVPVIGDEGKMDLHNNAEGRDCGCQVRTPAPVIGPRGMVLPDWNGSCSDCCQKKLRDRKLVTLPKKRW